MSNKAQATLEFTITFVLMMVLLFGLLTLWKRWCDKIIDRQHKYTESRTYQDVYDMGTGPEIPYWPDLIKSNP